MARILIGNIKGPKGDTGPRGPQGATGPQGPQGPLPPLVNNALATAAGVSALDAAMGKTLQDQITQNTQGITQLNSKMESIITSSPTGGSALRVPNNGIGNCVIWSNSTEEANYGSVFGDYNDTLNTELLLHNGSLVLKITRADQSTEQKVISSIEP